MRTGNGKWALSIALVLIAVLFAGCSGNSTGNSADSGSGQTPAASGSPSASAEADGGSADLSPITYTMNTANDKMTWDTPITKAFTEKTGVSLKYDLIVGDENQKGDLWLAAGDYPDIVAFGPPELQKYKEGGALVPLNDLIDQYGPHIKEKFGKYYNLLKDEDGKIWSLYGVNHSREARADASGNFIVQYDVLKEAGFPELKTLDDLYAVIAAYKEKHPTIDGKETIGFTGAMQGWQVGIEYNNPIISAAGLPDQGMFRIDDSGNVQYNPVSEDSKTYYQFLNKLYLAGLYDKEAFSQEDMQKKLAQGRVLAAYAPSWMIGDIEASFRADGHPERQYAHFQLHFTADTEDLSNTVTPTFAGSQQWAVTISANNPERIIQFFDFLFSDEGQILSHWGIEGVHYEVKDGRRVVKPEVIEKRNTDPDYNVKEGFAGNGTGSGYWFGIGDGAKLADGDYATPLTKDYILGKYDDMTKEVLGQYGKQVWADFLPPARVVPGYLWQLPPPQEVSLQAKKIEEAWKKFLPKFIMSKDGEAFDKNWNDMKSTMEKAGLNEVNAANTKIWKDFNVKFKATIGE